MRSAGGTWDFTSWFPAVVFGLVVVFLLVPIWGVVRASFINNETGVFTWGNYQRVLAGVYYRKVIVNSLVVSSGGMLGALLLGVPQAAIMNRFVIRGKRLVATLIVLSLISPPIIGAYAWIVLFGRNGFIRSLLLSLGVEAPTIYGAWGIIVCFTLQYYPFVFLFVSGALKAVNRTTEEAAENLGAGPLRRFFTITLPLIMPAVSAGGLIAFMLSIANFGTPVVIGRRFNVLSAMAYNQYTAELGGNLGMASTLSVILILCAFTALLLQVLVSSGKKYTGARLTSKPAREIRTPAGKICLHLVCYGIVFFSTLPLLVVVVMSFRNASGPVFVEGFGLGNYRQVLYELPLSISNSLIVSAASVVLLVTVGTLTGYVLSRRRTWLNGLLDYLLMVPFVVPGTVLGIGYITCFNSGPMVLTGTALILVAACSTRRLPYSVRSSAAIIKQIPASIEEASLSLGRSPFRTFCGVSLPLMKPGIAAGAIISFVMVINELSASAVLFTGGTVTMPVRIYQSVTNGDFGPAAALSTVLLVLTAGAVLVVNLVTEKNESMFIKGAAQ